MSREPMSVLGPHRTSGRVELGPLSTPHNTESSEDSHGKSVLHRAIAPATSHKLGGEHAGQAQAEWPRFK